MNLPLIDKKKTQYAFLTIIILFLVFSYAISLATFTSPTRELRWDSSVTLDPTYNRGDTININAFFEEGTSFIESGEYFNFIFSEDVYWVVTIYDPSNRPVYTKAQLINSATGDLSESDTYTIPFTAPLGIYHIRVFIWTNTLPMGDTRTRLINEETFEVK